MLGLQGTPASHPYRGQSTPSRAELSPALQPQGSKPGSTFAGVLIALLLMIHFFICDAGVKLMPVQSIVKV